MCLVLKAVKYAEETKRNAINTRIHQSKAYSCGLQCLLELSVRQMNVSFGLFASRWRSGKGTEIDAGKERKRRRHAHVSVCKIAKTPSCHSVCLKRE